MFEWASWHDKLPNEDLEVYEPHLKLFFETMHERQLIWKRRFIEQRPRPWTDNEIFRNSKFTNVYRELDRNSQWQIKNILLDSSLSRVNLIWKMMVFRFFNCPETFELGKSVMGWKNGIPDWNEYNEDTFTDFIADVRKRGQNPYTTAYLINSMATPGKSRDYCYTRLVIPTLHKRIPELISKVMKAESPEEIIKYLKTLPAIADFIAHEFYQDFTYIARYTNREFMKFDQNDFTNVGPGASVGIRLIFPNLKTKDQEPAIYRLKDMADEILESIGLEKGELFPYLSWDKESGSYFTFTSEDLKAGRIHRENLTYSGITLHQIEMWLCEFQKYWKMTIGEGKQRSKFEPKTDKLTLEHHEHK